jgi:phosphopantothenoylcysteine decarboxylase/phosphopantothenate--cysteine ligase
VRIVVTAGPTREPIDPVRFISNRSSGKMGYAIAEAALERGDDVTLISGPVALTAPDGARVIEITTADELHDAVHANLADCDVLVMCAAVSDYKPSTVSATKLEKRIGTFALQLTSTPDILRSLPTGSRSYLVVGFAAETHDVAASAQRKLRAKHCDMVVANDVSRGDSGMESDDNEVTIYSLGDEPKLISHAPKKIIAREILKIVLEFHQKSLTKKS